MVIFHSYVSLPEGKRLLKELVPICDEIQEQLVLSWDGLGVGISWVNSSNTGMSNTVGTEN